jgi:CBS domain-containing protein
MISANESKNPENSSSIPIEQVLSNEKVILLYGEPPVTVVAGAPLREALNLLRGSNSRGGAVVVVSTAGSDATVVGIFTQRDYLDKLADLSGQLDEPIDRFMTASPTTLSPDDTVDTAIRWMTEGGYRHLPVTDERGAPVGLVTTRDIIGHLADYFPNDVLNRPPRLSQGESIPTREGG